MAGRIRRRGPQARKSLLNDATTLDAALAIVRPFLDPVLTGSAAGQWDSRERLWVPGERASPECDR
jgi:hypothetical protein